LCPAIGWDGVLKTPCLGCSWTTVLLVSASFVVRSTGVSYHMLRRK
jgi:hypothetical protein